MGQAAKGKVQDPVILRQVNTKGGPHLRQRLRRGLSDRLLI
jgi:hypothetical protein